MSKFTKKYKDLIIYVVFGVLTTLINLIIFKIFSKILGQDLYLISNIIAFFGAVIFAFVTNKLIVFKSKSFEKKVFLKELLYFFLARVFSLLVEEIGLFILLDKIKIKDVYFSFLNLNINNQTVAKLFLAVIVVILNYIFSKFFIFKND